MKDQFIIANLPDLENTQAVIAYASHMAQRLSKGLILLHIADPRYESADSHAEERLQELERQITDIKASYCAIPGNTRQIVESLPTLLSGVLVVTPVDRSAGRKSPLNAKNILKDFSDCKTAYLTVPTCASEVRIKNVAFSVDFHRESKEKLIWASYFQRFGKSGLHVLYHDYKDEGLRQKWYNNMLFLNKFFNSLGVNFLPHIVPGRASAVDADALPFMDENQMDLLVAVTTKEKDIFDSILGSQEQKSIINPFDIPILFLNPRDDLYVLCD